MVSCYHLVGKPCHHLLTKPLNNSTRILLNYTFYFPYMDYFYLGGHLFEAFRHAMVCGHICIYLSVSSWTQLLESRVKLDEAETLLDQIRHGSDNHGKRDPIKASDSERFSAQNSSPNKEKSSSGSPIKKVGASVQSIKARLGKPSQASPSKRSQETKVSGVWRVCIFLWRIRLQHVSTCELEPLIIKMSTPCQRHD